MPLRTRIFIFISAAILLILGVSLLLIAASKKAKQNKVPASSTSTVGTSGNNGAIQDTANYITDTSGSISGQTGTKLTIQPLSSEEIEKNAVKQLAKIFIERYGSYSSDNNFQNIKEVKSLSTASLWTELSKKINSAPQTSFVGVTTKVITSKVSDWSSGTATASLETTRTEENNGVIKNSQQSATVYLVYSSSKWLVDKFEWK